ncbi:MAG: hypothetical protein DMH00_12285, partial [Acidobacteria bacterium]
MRISTGNPNGAIYLTDPVTLPTGDSREFFSARSLAPGSVSNAPAGVFTRHNFTGYTDSRFGTLLVTNNFGLVGGRDAESDDDYRFRLNLKIQSRAGANEAALRLELLEIPGIQDVVFERQAGAFIVYVYGISPNVSPGLLQNVQDSLNDKAAYPLAGLAVAPDLVGISLSTTVEFKAGTSAEEKSLALSAAASVENLRTPGSHVVFRRQDQPGLCLHTALLPPCKSAAGRTPRNPSGAAQDAAMGGFTGGAGK